MGTILEIKSLCKTYQSRAILKNLNLKIDIGERVGIVGGSGYGKSTLLNIVANIESIDSGTVHRNFKKVGYSFQEDRLFPWLKAYENIMLPLIAKGISKKSASLVAKELMEKFSLKGAISLYPRELSGGMRARVSLARAFILKPDLLLLDEPFSSVDVKTKLNLIEFLKKMTKEYSQTLIYVSHMPEEIVSIVDKIYILKNRFLKPIAKNVNTIKEELLE